MTERGDGIFRELLVADLAVEKGEDPARVGAALAQYWKTRDPAALDDLRALVADDLESALAAADGNARIAVAMRGGLDRTLIHSVPALSEAGARSRARLRDLDPERYVEFEPLGEGGMGVVYLALDTELNRRVAFKMVRASDGTGTDPLDGTPQQTPDEDKARFLQEAWVTGGLEHPGIVPVYELGRTPSGAPYYTMRLVRGERTLEDAINAATEIDARLTLLEPFLKTCDAVRYAHSRAVIHRDLKPANIALGGFGEVVVLDWGLAKLKDHPDIAQSRWHERMDKLRTDSQLQTIAGVMGTPGYMAPEALRGELERVDERSDVYSLGVILYRALTGRFPLGTSDLMELFDRIQSEVPTAPRELDPAVPDGLSRVCMKALAIDPGERYAGAGELANAIRAWQGENALGRELAAMVTEAQSGLAAAQGLTGEALLHQLDRVLALTARIGSLKPDHVDAVRIESEARNLRSAAIESRERVARTRLLKRVAVVGLTVAAAGAVLVAVLLDEKRREADDARQRAEAERGRAEELSHFMLTDMRDRLAPLGRLDLLQSVARKALAHHESLPEENQTGQSWIDRSLALDNVGDVLVATGDLPTAEASYAESLAIRKRLCAADPARTGWQRDLSVSFGKLADLRFKRGDLDASDEANRECLAIRERLVASDPSNALWRQDLAASFDSIGNVQAARGDLESAQASRGKAVAIFRTIVADDPGSTASQRELSISLVKLGDVQRDRGDLKAARASFGESLEVVRRIADSEPDNLIWQRDLTVSLERFAQLLSRQGETKAAEETYAEQLAIARRLVRWDPTNTLWRRDLAATLDKVGRLQSQRGALADAVASWNESLAIFRRLAAADPTNTVWQRDLAVALSKLVAVAQQQGDLDAALNHHSESLEILRRLAMSDPANAEWQDSLAASLANLAGVQERRGDVKSAETSLAESLSIRRRLAESDPSNGDVQLGLISSLSQLGDVQLARRDIDAAQAMYAEALLIGERLAKADPANLYVQRELARALEQVGNIQIERRELDAAQLTRSRSHAIRKRLAESDPENAAWQRELAVSASMLGQIQSEAGDLESAEASAAESLATFRKLAASDPSNTRAGRDLAMGILSLGDIQIKRENIDGALASYTESLAIRRRLARSDSTNAMWQRDVYSSLDAIARVYEAKADLRRAAEALSEAVERCALLVQSAPHLDAELRYLKKRSRRVSLLGGLLAPESPADHLALAESLYDRKKFADSARHYEQALQDEETRKDLDQAALYNAACAAALAGTDEWRAKSMIWLADDIGIRRALLPMIDAELQKKLPDEQRTRIQEFRAGLLAHFEHARIKDSDLASLRGTAEFDKLFVGLPR